MARNFAQIAFTPAVRAAQESNGSADAYAKFLSPDADRGSQLTERETDFIVGRDGFYQATVSETGWPYVQFRGGPVGFLKLVDDKTIAYADFRGNRQYISTGNLAGDDRVLLILMDYPNQRRLKLWGHARLVDAADDPELIERLHDSSYKAKPERAVVIAIEAFDWNCPQHITPRFDAPDVAQAIGTLQRRIEELEAENKALREKTPAS